MKFYAVRRGKQIGVFSTWKACQAQVKGFSGAQYKSFPTKIEAEAYVAGQDPAPHQPSPIPLKKGQGSDSQTQAHIWVDGSCIPQSDGTLLLGWAFLVLINNEEIHRDSGNDIPSEAHQHRNVAGEIMAVVKALAWCQDEQIRDLSIYHDYEGLASWATGAWEAKTPFTRAYRDNIRNSGLTFHWVKVKAHSGEEGNEIVDKMAREAALKKTGENQERL